MIMSVVHIETTDLQELRREIDSVIKKIEVINETYDLRIAQFDELNLTTETKEQILNILFSERE